MIFANIDTSAYAEEETLFLIRIKGKQQFFDVGHGPRVMENLFGHIQRHRTISEYRNADHYIDLNRYDLPDLVPADYDVYYACIHDDLPAIIARCRGLRSIPFDEAKTLVLFACKFFNEFFQTQPYKLVVIHLIDNYVLDVMYRVARHKNIEVLCLSEWFIENYRRHTVYGELHQFREPTDEEITRVEKHFLLNKKPIWLNGVNRVNRLRYAGYLVLRYWILYFTRYLVRYRLLGNNEYEYRFANRWKIRLGGFFVGRYFDEVDVDYIAKNEDRLVVVPLHIVPEANVDYWMTDYRHADYYTSLFEAISFFRSKGLTVLVKEHPQFLYLRNPAFYRRLKKFENVRLIDPMSESAPLLDRIPLLLVWHGTMGIEALMGGRRVVAFNSNYYSKGLIPAYRDFESARPLEKAQRRGFIRYLLTGVQEI